MPKWFPSAKCRNRTTLNNFYNSHHTLDDKECVQTRGGGGRSMRSSHALNNCMERHGGAKSALLSDCISPEEFSAINLGNVSLCEDGLIGGPLRVLGLNTGLAGTTQNALGQKP